LRIFELIAAKYLEAYGASGRALIVEPLEKVEYDIHALVSGMNARSIKFR